ncbi:ABC transporter substrate-binding protein [Rufibacter latericius]|uniref:ABC transporter substrate-binding protein n=1 Tax=Rufibacter latericius TaxID=2487040 RepID=UPI0014026959|nr:ABC transporter substrate-binding protein [Rufibacter latericius]
MNYLYQSLLTVDITDKSIQPLLASDLPSLRREDSLSYFTFSIRPQAKWDNGSPVTAQDVAFSLKLLHSPLLDNERWRAQYDFIKDIQLSPANPKNFTLVCSGYTPEMKLMVGDFFILPAHQFDSKGILSTVPFRLIRQKFDSLAQTSTFQSFANTINSPAMAKDSSLVKGSGPYLLRSWKPGQVVALEKKKDWWGKGVSSQTLKANPARILFQILPDNAAAVLALKAQQVDVMDNIPLISFQEMRKDKKYQQLFHFYSPTSYDLAYLGMNGNNPLLSHRLTRQALAHLLNPEQYIKELQGGLATPTVGFIHPQEKEFYNSELKPVTYNQQKAKSLLTSAGWKQTPTGWSQMINGRIRTLELELLHKAGNSDFENMGLLFQQNAKAVGIPVTLQALESSQITERLQNGKFGLFFRTLVGNPFSYNLIPLLHTSNAQEGGANVTGFGNKETDVLLEKIAQEEQPTDKALLLKTLQQKMQEESNIVFLYFTTNKIAVSKRLDSVVVSGLKPGYDLLKSSLRK